MAGQHHVLVAIPAHAHGLAGLVRRSAASAAGVAACVSLPPKAAAHPQALHDDFVGGQLQQMRHKGLDLGRVLRGRGDEHGPVLAALGPCRLRFQIESVPALASSNTPFSVIGAISQCRADLAAADEVRRVVEAARGQRLFQREDRRQRLVFNHHLLRRGSTSLLRFANDQRHDLAVEPDLLVRQQNLVLLDGADVVFAGTSSASSTALMPGMARAAVASRLQDLCLRVRRTNRPNFQRTRRLVVGVNRFAGDVLVRALVRWRPQWLGALASPT